MKTLYLVRHAKSSWDFPELTDSERPLNKRGRKDAPMMAQIFQEKEGIPDKLVTSPAVRALNTCIIFSSQFGIDRSDIQVEGEIYEAFPSTIIRLVQAFDESWNSACLFGHNPTFTDVANWFTTRMIPNVPTCGIIKIMSPVKKWADFSPDQGNVTATYFPKDFKN